MRLSEEDLGERFFFLIRAKIKPLECAVDIRKGKKAIRVPVIQSFLDGLMSDNSRDKRGTALDDIILWFAPFQPLFDSRA